MPMPMPMPMPVPVSVPVPGTAGSDAQGLVHGDKGEEADDDCDAEQQVAAGLDEDEAGAGRVVLAEEDLGQQVEEGVAEQAADGEGDHDGQRGRVDGGRAQRQQEVGRPRDVQRRQQRVDARVRRREEHREEARREGRRREGGRVRRRLGLGQGADYGALLYLCERE